MADINKPDLTNLWASDGAVIPPSPAKIQTGWVAEIPPHQWENYVQNRQDVALAYLLQKGIPEWDNTTEYIANKSVVTHDGNIYFAVQTDTNRNPSSSPSHWIPLEEKFADSLGLGTAAYRDVGTSSGTVAAGDDSRITGAAQKSANLSDLTDPSTARTNLGLGTSAELDIATTAQAQELTNDATVITPKKLGDAMNAHVLGMGQTWQDVSRSADTNYTNTTGRPIGIALYGEAGASTGRPLRIASLYINNLNVARMDSSDGDPSDSTIFSIIPAGAEYRVEVTGFVIGTNLFWRELR